MHRLATSLLVLLIINAADGQTYPQNFFRHPLNIRMELVGNFGEIRTNHWHMGLDIRTQQRENLPVYASADGFVSRVVVEPGGFGQAIYIDHPNGLTTLYAHMNAFYPALAQYVEQQQYEKETWKIDLKLPPQMFTLKKGAYIGRSGNTGGSAGPHVHFEIRDTRTGKVLNPLLFNFPVADAVAPIITRLAMYNRNKSTYHQAPQLLTLKRNGRNYSLPSSLRVGTNRLSFAIGAIDRFSNSTNPNGIYSARISMDGQPVSEFIHDSIDYIETRLMNAQIDYPWKARGGAAVQHLTPLPGAVKLPYNVFSNNGIIVLNDEQPHEIEIEVKDAKGNTSMIRFSVRYDPALEQPFEEPPTEKFIPLQVNVFETENFELYAAENSLYDTVYISYKRSDGTGKGSVSDLHAFLDHTIPVHDSVTVRIKPSTDIDDADRDKLLIKNVSGKRTIIQKAEWSNGMVMGRFRQFGTFQVFVDNEPPAINNPPASLAKSRSIVFTPTDNFNVIKSFRAELNGKWLMFSNDKGRRWIYRFDEHFPRGNHELKVVIEDAAGNTTTKVWNVRR